MNYQYKSACSYNAFVGHFGAFYFIGVYFVIFNQFKANLTYLEVFMDISPTKLYFTVEEAAEYLHVSPATIYRFIASKKLPVFRFGRIMRINVVDLESFIKKYTITEINI